MHRDTLQVLQGQKEVAFDWETTSLSVFTCRLLGLALANADGDTTFVTSKAECIEVFNYFNEHKILALGYNIKYDLGVNKAHGIPLPELFLDVYSAVKLYDERWPRYRLSNVAAKLVDPAMGTYKDEFGEYLKEKYGKKASFESVQEEDLGRLSEYAETDALCTILIWKKIQPALEQWNLLDLLDLENSVVRTLVDIHYDGVTINRPYLIQARETLGKILEYIEAQSRTYTDSYTEEVEHKEGRGKNRKVWTTVEHVDINLMSGLQVGKVMKMLGIESAVKTATGNDSWSAEALEAIDHPFAHIVNDYRSYMKLLTAFVEPWIEKSERDGRLHPEFNHIGATTGRMSCSQPNLQQMPRYGKSTDLDDLKWVSQIHKDNPELYREGLIQERRAGWSMTDAMSVAVKGAEDQINIRRAIVADDENHVLIKMDYQQMEVAIFTHFCQDPTMIRVINEGQDIHFEMAKEMGFDIPAGLEWGEKAKKNEKYILYRRLAKSVIFGLLYGIGPRTLSIQLGTGQAEAKALMNRWFERFPLTKQYIDACYRDIETKGYVQTLFGRRRRLYPSEAYKAVNAVVQGSSADVVKAAMVEIHRQLWPQAEVKIIVHDEFVVQTPKNQVADTIQKMGSIMCNFDVNPRLRVDYSYGYEYGSKE